MAPGRCYKTHQDVDDGFGGFPPACREYTHPRHDPDARVFVAILEGTVIGPVVGVRVALLLNHHGIVIEIPSPSRPEMSSWDVICRGRNRVVEELRTLKPVYYNTSSELLTEQAIAKKSEPCSMNVEQSSTEET